MYLITAAPEFSQDVFGKHLRIAAYNINIRMFDFHQSKHDIHKADLTAFQIRIVDFLHKLYLIDENVICLPVIYDFPPNVIIQFVRIPISSVVEIIKRYPNHMIIINAIFPQKASVYVK